jgi:hypothetical protein
MKKVLFTLAAVVALSACNIKLKGKDEPKGPPPEEKVEGPNIEGQWLSACESNFREGGYRVLDVTYGPATASRKSHLYHDIQCQQLSKTEVKEGTYKYTAANKDGSYTVEYRIPIGNGWFSLPKENILLENNTLFISDFVIGDGINKSLMVRMQRKVATP